MNYLKTLWSWLDGRKTVFGAILFFIAQILDTNSLVDVDTLNTLQAIAALVTGTGLTHKVVKMRNGK